MLPSLFPDALRTTPDGCELRIGLPWIRSLPLAGLRGLAVAVDGTPVYGLQLVLGDRRVGPDAVADLDVWWFLQDRLVVAAPVALARRRHHVSVDFSLSVPYLSAGPAGPLVLPFHIEADLEPDRAVTPGVAGEVGRARR